MPGRGPRSRRAITITRYILPGHPLRYRQSPEPWLVRVFCNLRPGALHAGRSQAKVWQICQTFTPVHGQRNCSVFSPVRSGRSGSAVTAEFPAGLRRREMSRSTPRLRMILRSRPPAPWCLRTPLSSGSTRGPWPPQSVVTSVREASQPLHRDRVAHAGTGHLPGRVALTRQGQRRGDNLNRLDG